MNFEAGLILEGGGMREVYKMADERRPKMDVQQILRDAVEKKVSDIFILAGLPVSHKTNDKVEHVDERLTPAVTEEFIRGIYALAGGRDITHLLEVGDEDFSFSIEGVSRFRGLSFRRPRRTKCVWWSV